MAREPKLQARIDGGFDELREPEPDADVGRPPAGTWQLPDDVPMHVSGAQLARVLGVTYRRVLQLAGEGLPKLSRGRWDLEVAVPWYVEFKVKQASPDDGTTLDAERRRALARASIAELQAARYQGEVYNAEEVRAMVAELGQVMRQAIIAAPAALEYDDPRERLRAEELAEAISRSVAGAAQDVGPGTRDNRRNARAAAAPKRE